MFESEQVQTSEGECNVAKPGQTPRVVPSMTTPGEEIANIEEAARCLSLISSNHKKLLRNALVWRNNYPPLRTRPHGHEGNNKLNSSTNTLNFISQYPACNYVSIHT